MSTKGIICGALAAVAVVAVLTAEKPNFAYTPDGKPRSFGAGDEDTLVPVWLLGAVVGVSVYALEIM